MESTDHEARLDFSRLAFASPPRTPSRLPTFLVGFSTKTYFTLPRTLHYIDQLIHSTRSASASAKVSANLSLFIIPSFPALPLAAERILGGGTLDANIPSSDNRDISDLLWLGAQNVNSAPPGAFTGEVSAAMLSSLGCRLVEIGHAERRRAPFHETDDFIAEKAKAVVSEGMVPLVCIGEKTAPTSESSSAADAGPMSAVVGTAVREVAVQMQAVLDAVPATAAVIFAYEPVWAIGASQPAGADYVKAVVGGLRIAAQAMRKGAEASAEVGDVRFLYGGSAGPGIWDAMGGGVVKGGVDGLFLGRFAHDVGRMVDVVKEVGQQ